jgi:hypothetical protein
MVTAVRPQISLVEYFTFEKKRIFFSCCWYRHPCRISQFITQAVAVKRFTFYLLLSSRCSQLNSQRTRLENASVCIEVQEECTLPRRFICCLFKCGICSSVLNEVLSHCHSTFLSVISLIFQDKGLFIYAIMTVTAYMAFGKPLSLRHFICL